MIKGMPLIIRRNLSQHILSTFVTVISVALGIGLVMSVFNIKEQSHKAFTGGPVGFDAVLGARGSQLQLVLNTVFHLETSPGNISWESYRQIARDPAVELAVPYAVGDNYKGYRVVGTTEEMWLSEDKTMEVVPGGRLMDFKRREALAIDPIGCCWGTTIGLNQWILVDMPEGALYDPYTTIKIIGTFVVGEEFGDNGEISSIYRLNGTKAEYQTF